MEGSSIERRTTTTTSTAIATTTQRRSVGNGRDIWLNTQYLNAETSGVIIHLVHCVLVVGIVGIVIAMDGRRRTTIQRC